MDLKLEKIMGDQLGSVIAFMVLHIFYLKTRGKTWRRRDEVTKKYIRFLCIRNFEGEREKFQRSSIAYRDLWLRDNSFAFVSLLLRLCISYPLLSFLCLFAFVPLLFVTLLLGYRFFAFFASVIIFHFFVTLRSWFCSFSFVTLCHYLGMFTSFFS